METLEEFALGKSSDDGDLLRNISNDELVKKMGREDLDYNIFSR